MSKGGRQLVSFLSDGLEDTVLPEELGLWLELELELAPDRTIADGDTTELLGSTSLFPCRKRRPTWPSASQLTVHFGEIKTHTVGPLIKSILASSALSRVGKARPIVCGLIGRRDRLGSLWLWSGGHDCQH